VARAALGAVFLATTLLGAPVLAEKARREVRLEIRDCSPSAVDLRAAYAAAALELGIAGTRGGAAAEQGGVELEAALACDRGVKARLTLRTEGSSAARTITLDDANVKDRARVLALALAELVRAEWRWVTTGSDGYGESPPGDERLNGADGQRGSSAESNVAPKGDAPERGNRDGPRRTADAGLIEPTDETPGDDGLRLEVLGRVRGLFEGPTLAYGGAAGARWRRWSAAVEALFGRARGRLGTATSGVADARVGFEIVRLTLGRVRLSAEPGLATGATWLSGEASRPTVEVANATRFYADVRLALRAELALATVSPTFALEGGRAAGFVATESGHTLGATGGWFVGGAFGVTLGGDGL
jgi:hypothetical protein